MHAATLATPKGIRWTCHVCIPFLVLFILGYTSSCCNALGSQLDGMSYLRNQQPYKFGNKSRTHHHSNKNRTRLRTTTAAAAVQQRGGDNDYVGKKPKAHINNVWAADMWDAAGQMWDTHPAGDVQSVVEMQSSADCGVHVGALTYNMSVYATQTGFDITLQRQTPTRPNLTHVANESFFDVLVAGPEGVHATMCSERAAGGGPMTRRSLELSTCRFCAALGDYDVFVRIVHHNRTEALGQEEYMHAPQFCILRQPFSYAMAKYPQSRATSNNSNIKCPSPTVWTLPAEKGLQEGVQKNKQGVIQGEQPKRWPKLQMAQQHLPPLRSAVVLTTQPEKKIKVNLVGDSHSRSVYENVPHNYNDQFANAKVFEWGYQPMHGIWHNNAPDTNLTAFMAGTLKTNLTESDFLHCLRSGACDEKQRVENWDFWVVQSGHGDLRDDPLEVYLANVNALLLELASFRRRNPGMDVIWMGAPPYSFKRSVWNGKEKRTNVRLMIGDRHVRRVARELNIKAISFFDIALPFYKESCDSHHYLMQKCGPIGVAHVQWLIHAMK